LSSCLASGKGAIENVNGVIRVELPRQTNIDALKRKEVMRITKEINSRPLKCLNAKHPPSDFLKGVNRVHMCNENL
jgi:IS30 family transposase